MSSQGSENEVDVGLETDGQQSGSRWVGGGNGGEKAMCPKLRRQEKEFKSVKDGEEKKKKKKEGGEGRSKINPGLHPGLQRRAGDQMG